MTMARNKQRVVSHIMEEKSYQIIKQILPTELVIREFNRPDYGIDLVIELFRKKEDKIFETLGEFIFVQVKSMENIDFKKTKIYPVQNVAKEKWKEDKSEYSIIEIAKYTLDTNSIYSIQTLGFGVSVLLFLVDIKNEDVYFVCMTDYIEKVILPQKPNYAEQKSVTINIPKMNNLKNKDISHNALNFYGKRAKLLSAFSKFHYQQIELMYATGYEFNKIIKLASYFIEQIENLDIWEYKDWQILEYYKNKIVTMKKMLLDIENNNFEDIKLTIRNLYQEAALDVEIDEIGDFVKMEINELWRGLTVLGRNYEELCREWFLPKMVGLFCSYPQMPEVIKSKESY